MVRPQFRPLSASTCPTTPRQARWSPHTTRKWPKRTWPPRSRCPRAARPARRRTSFIGVSQSGVDGSFVSRIIPALGDSCATCHPNQAAFWARTRHARAYQSLVAKGKQFSFDCIACHTTGWQQPGGVCRIDRTEVGGPGVATPAERTGRGFDQPLPERLALGRQGVQCEDCHGPASEHARMSKSSQLIEEIPESTCKRCHDFANSPHFDFRTYRPWVIGPGHGEVLLDGAPVRTRGELAAGNKLGPNAALFEQSGVQVIRAMAERLAFGGIPNLRTSWLDKLAHGALVARGAEQWTSQLAGQRVQRYAIAGKGGNRGAGGAAGARAQRLVVVDGVAAGRARAVPRRGSRCSICRGTASRRRRPGGPASVVEHAAMVLAALDELARETGARWRWWETRSAARSRCTRPASAPRASREWWA